MVVNFHPSISNVTFGKVDQKYVNQIRKEGGNALSDVLRQIHLNGLFSGDHQTACDTCEEIIKLTPKENKFAVQDIINYHKKAMELKAKK
jgi:hypothetical protein